MLNRVQGHREQGASVERLCDIEAKQADLVIRPELRAFGPGLEWGAEFIAAGERAGMQAAPKIRAQWARFADHDRSFS